MQDRFKFRVWLPFEKRMITTDKESFFALNQHGSLLKINDKNEAFFARIGHTFSKENIMQCTGLKDKNGKLIYEGDILIQKEENEGLTKKLVIWEEDGGYLGLKDLKKSFFGVVTFHRFGYTYEVIGNIYENPELLEDNK